MRASRWAWRTLRWQGARLRASPFSLAELAVGNLRDLVYFPVRPPEVGPGGAGVSSVHRAHEPDASRLHLLPRHGHVVDQEPDHRARGELFLVPKGRPEDLHRLPAGQAQERELSFTSERFQTVVGYLPFKNAPASAEPIEPIPTTVTGARLPTITVAPSSDCDPA